MRKHTKLFNSQKMRVFYTVCLLFLIFWIFNVFIIKNESIFIQIIWGLTTLAGITVSGKVADDYQKSKYFKEGLNGGKCE